MSDDAIIKGLSRLAYQFETSEKFRDFITSFLSEFQELNISGLQLLNERYLDTAIGLQLDGIGEIVGLPRPGKPVDQAGVFGFLDDQTALGFGTILDLNAGGNFVSIYDVGSTTPIGDNLYRLLIRAKIIKNQTAMTVDDTLRLISFTYGGISVRYVLAGNLHPTYDIGRILDQFEASLVEDFPILIGIENVEYHMHSETTPFGFDGDDESLGFSTIADSTIGGNFAQII